MQLEPGRSRTSAPSGPDGKAVGRNGILVWKADDVSVENLTVCNFLGRHRRRRATRSGGTAGTAAARSGCTATAGSYLTATSTYFGAPDADQQEAAAQYGIFSSNAAGPGVWNQLYASNFNDSGMYVGACQQVCDVTIDHAWMEYNALGYSGTNSGGAVVIENSQFDNNQDGLDTNTQIDGDPPAPQNGACPDNGISPITHTHSCWVFIHNDVHDNNNPERARGRATPPPARRDRHDAVGRAQRHGHGQHVLRQRGLGDPVRALPRPSTPSLGQTCPAPAASRCPASAACTTPKGDALLHNTFSHNGYFGNPSNSRLRPDRPQRRPAPELLRRATPPRTAARPPDLEQIQPTCGRSPRRPTPAARSSPRSCATPGFGHRCPPGPSTRSPPGWSCTRCPRTCPPCPIRAGRARQRLVPGRQAGLSAAGPDLPGDGRRRACS